MSDPSTASPPAGRKLNKRIRVRSGKIPSAYLKAMSEGLRQGDVAIFPTETVYGLGTSAFSPEGIRRIHALKGRRVRKPLALLVPSLEAARPLIESAPPEAHRLGRSFWPGPLTLILRASSLGKLVTGGLSTLAVRVPAHPHTQAILRAVGVPLATTSVNKSGEKPASSGPAARRLFGSKVEWFLDGGPCRVKTASTVVDLSDFPFSIKREGAISKKEMERILLEKHP